jgi:hypothetical protein
LPALLSILDKFVSEYENAATPSKAADAIFWNSMVKRGGTMGSGARTFFSGWINVFFPYLIGTQERSNPFAYVPYDEKTFSVVHKRPGPDVNFFPSGLSKVSVTWAYFDQEIPLEFNSGFLCAKQDPTTKAISPVICWYIMRI